MPTLTIIPYVPKPPNGSIRKTPSKFIAGQPSSLGKSFQINSNDVPIEVLLALGGAAGNYNWCQKAVGDSEAIVQDAQVSGDDLVGTRSMYSGRPRRGPLSLSDAIQQGRWRRRMVPIMIPIMISPP
jgi:hypothetical protein